MKFLTGFLPIILLLTACLNNSEKLSDNPGNIPGNSGEPANSNNDFSEITGKYAKLISDETANNDCKLTVEISSRNGEFYYVLKSTRREAKGKATFTYEKASDETYVVLEGIRWDEYGGDMINQDEDTVYKEIEEENIPVGISALITGDTFNIQNYGNSMNYYVLLSECSEKFILLKKQ